MRQERYPAGWDEERVRRVLEHYETQSDEEAVADDEAAYEATTHTAMDVPVEVVPAVRELIAKQRSGEVAWRNVADIPEEELKQLFGPWARKVRMDLTPVELNHPEKGPELRVKFQEHLRASIDTEIEAIISRAAELPVLHVYDGPYMPLLQEARELYVMGYFYSCVVTCGVPAEKILRDMFRRRLAVAWPPHALTDDEMKHLNRLEAMQVLEFLGKLDAVRTDARKACQDAS